jgi:hypothetical protein
MPVWLGTERILEVALLEGGQHVGRDLRVTKDLLVAPKPELPEPCRRNGAATRIEQWAKLRRAEQSGVEVSPALFLPYGAGLDVQLAIGGKSRT